MSERCPLISLASDEHIPDVCREQCGELWEKAAAEQPPEHDEFNRYSDEENGCSHLYSEAGVESLQPGSGPERLYGINEDCMNCGVELASDSYAFACPYN